MTSGTGSNNAPRARGYTLLEICIALAILALVTASAVPSLAGWLAEERLREPARQLALLARTARLRAIETQRPFVVAISPERAALLSTPEGGTEREEEARPFPPSVTVAVRPWGEEAFSAPGETRWRFEADGLCAPLAVRLSQGRSEIALTFDPLTADVAEEAYAFR